MMPLPNTKPQTTSEQYKTGTLQETAHFTWNTADVVGRGATANVYYGRHKSSGDVCAVKVFYDREWRHQTTTRQREIETLRSLDHENIVKLLALETENVTGHVVLVMEYCAGGSVFAMLETPQYSLGFHEEEFRLFLTHICNGLNYIRSKGYIHRDIKPGNIMRFIALDGRSLFKLTDFGAARELQDDETFHSIYGTEEYLYPKMYERAVLRHPGASNSTFNISVDIWSLGVTIYHVCTGQLPFQPFGGRSNAFTMFEITSKKPSGVISGTQKVQNGPISWNRKLPNTCLLSDQLQELIVPVLSGLMEVDPTKMWSFETFFQHVERLDSMKVIKVFFCGTAQLIHLYVDRTDNLARIQEKLAMQTDIPTMNQLLLYKDRDVRDCVDAMMPAHTLDRAFFKETLILLNIVSMDNYVLVTQELPTFPAVLSYENLDSDAQIAKKSTSLAHYCQIKVIETLNRQKLLVCAEQNFRKYIKYSVRHFELVLPEITCTIEEAELRLKSFSSNTTTFLALFETLNSLNQSGAISLSGLSRDDQVIGVIHQLQEYAQDGSLKRFYEKIRTRLNEINVYTEVLSRKINDQEKDLLKMSLGCQDEDHCLSKVEYLKTMVANVSTTMAKHRKYRDLHAHESFIHKCEKEKLQEYTVNIWSLLKEHCIRNLELTYKHILREIGNLSKHLTRTKKVEQNIYSVKESMSLFSRTLGENETKFSEMILKISSLLETGISRPVEFSIREANIEYTSCRSRPVGAEATLKTAEESSSNPSWTKAPSSWNTVPSERKELHSHIQNGGGTNSAPPTISSQVKMASEEELKQRRQRAELLSLLTDQLSSLQKDSEDLKRLVAENSVMMEKFLNETSNLHLEGSLDSDQRGYAQDDT